MAGLVCWPSWRRSRQRDAVAVTAYAPPDRDDHGDSRRTESLTELGRSRRAARLTGAHHPGGMEAVGAQSTGRGPSARRAEYGRHDGRRRVAAGLGTCLYGRRMYEVLVAWETMSLDGQPPVVRDYAGGRQVLRTPSMASTRRPNGTASTGRRDRSGRARRGRRVVQASALRWAWSCRSATLALDSS